MRAKGSISMARRRKSNRRRRGSFGFLYKLLSILVICGAVVAAVTLFFRVNHVEILGEERYTEEEILEASAIETGDNLYLLNKNAVAGGIRAALPYIEQIRINRRLPDTLVIEVKECGTPFALVQEGSAWLISPKGMIVDQLTPEAAADYGTITGCQLLAPTVGTHLALATEYAQQQESLLALMKALEELGMLADTDGIRLDDLSAIHMDYLGRFTVKMPYGADYILKLKMLRQAIESDKVQDNMTGTFDMMRENGRIYLDQSTR